MRRKLKRIGALALVIAMLLSMFAESLAANEPQDSASALSTASTSEVYDSTNAVSGGTGKPRLYVDFLGDNAGHNSVLVDGNPTGFGKPTGTLSTSPERYDYSVASGKGGNWDRYDSSPIYYNGNDTIFYVGVGIDRMNLLKVLEGANNGVYSFEAGFYYNPYYVEPYVANGDYAQTIADVNLSKGEFANTDAGNTHWSSDSYNVVEAYTNLAPQFDGGYKEDGSWGELTQEVLRNPANEGIEEGIWSEGRGWKMTYVSIEMTAEQLEKAATARLDDVYDGKYHPVDDTDTGSNLETEYLLIIPFVLKRHDSQENLCFRLIRNATHLSLGAMGDSANGGAGTGIRDGGSVNYAAWERVTTRNSDSNLKLQTTFTGDLNIFTGRKASEDEYTFNAELRLDNGGKRSNTVDVRVTDDPSPNPAFITLNREVLTGLSGGTGITVTIDRQSRFDVKVNVYLESDDDKDNPPPLITLDPMGVDNMDEYTFIMPEADVIIEVIFTLDPSEPRNYEVTLVEENRLGLDDDVNNSPAGSAITGNFTSIDGTYAPSGDTTIESDTPPVDRDGNPYGTIEAGTTVKVTTTLHSDYYAVVRLVSVDGTTFPPGTRPNPPASQIVTEGSEVTMILYTTGSYTFDMPATDVNVEVTYVYAPHHPVQLEIKHVDEEDKLAKVNRLNRAQVSAIGSDDANQPERHYGGVYRDGEDDNAYSVNPDVEVRNATDDSRIGNIYPVPIGDTSATGSISGDKEPTNPYTEPDGLPEISIDPDPVTVRAGDEVRVAVEASSAYLVDTEVNDLGDTVDRVVVFKRDSTDPNDFFYATKDPKYSNIYTFVMPDYPVRVEVYYTPRTAPDLSLEVADVDGAEVEVAANTFVNDAIYPQVETITNTGVDKKLTNVLAGGMVTVTLTKVPDNYTAKVIVVTDEGDRLVATVPSNASGLLSTQKVTFVMPNEDATVHVTFIADEQTEHTAYIFVTDIDGNTVAGSDAYFNTDGGQAAIIEGPAATKLPGVIRVPAGYYIHAVTAIGSSTAYPFTQSGNGWANGAATDVNIDSTMPNEDIFITAIIKQGPPPVDPFFATTLFVDDPDNTASPYADNSATMTFDANGDGVRDNRVDVDGDGALDARPNVVGYPPQTTDQVSSDTAYTNGGTVVYVDLTIADGYYVSSVTFSPGYYGVGAVWLDAEHFYFITPENSIAVTVEYAKLSEDGPTPDDEDYWKTLTIDKTENGVANSGENAGNTVTSVTYKYLTTDYTKAAVGSIEGTDVAEFDIDTRTTVSAEIAVANGWYIASVRLVYGGYTQYLSVDTTDSTVTFTMPTVDAQLIVDYREGERKAGEHTLTLIVDDPYNVIDDTQTVLVDNYAWADVYAVGSDTATDKLGEFGLGTTGKGVLSGSTVAVVGDTVTIRWSTVPGYALDLLAVTATSTPTVDGSDVVTLQYTPIMPQYTLHPDGSTTATFTMPDADTTILVRFLEGGERLYRADLVIYDPDDTANVVDNRASFKELDDDPNCYVINSLRGGEHIPVYIEAVDGYYIDSVTVTPYSTGVTTTLTGAFGKQSAAFYMPAADVQVNVTFRKAWPSDPDDPDDDAAKFDVLLTVVDQTMNTVENYARYNGIGVTNPANVAGGETRVPVARLADGKIGNIYTNHGEQSYVKKVEIYDAAGNAVDWWWSAQYANTIEFYMPPTDIEVIVTYKTVEGDIPKYNATLHVAGRNFAEGEATLSVVEANGNASTTRTTGIVAVGGINPAENTGVISGIPTGELLKITVNNPGAGYIVSSVYAICEDTNTVLVLHSSNTGGESLITGGGNATFSMPAEDVTVHVVFDKALDPHQAIANLEVSGPGHSGSAELLEWRGDDPYDPNDTLGLTSTGALSPADSGYIVLGEALTARVDITPAENHAIKSVTVVDRNGNPVEFDWILTNTAYTTESGIKDPQPLAAITYQQPAGGSWVKVEFELIDTDRKYTARVVVNNAGNASNSALINGIDAISQTMTGWVKLIENAKPNTIIDLQITCAQGYRFDITVLPQSHNIHPTLTENDTVSQTTGFLMPADDVIVYVRFEADTRTRYNASLSVYSDVKDSESSATITSSFSGSKSADVGETVSVQALPAVEWITVTPHPATGEYLSGVTVQTVSGIPVLYEIDKNGVIRFPMAGENVEVALTFDDTSPTYSVRLYAIAHIDFSAVSNGKATIALADGRSALKDALYDDRATYAEIDGVAAGEIIDVTASLSQAALDAGEYYIDTAYAEYREGPYKGQRIALNFEKVQYLTGTGTSTSTVIGEYASIDDAWFVMQPYPIDVYVRYGKMAVGAPTAEYNVKLEIYGDEGKGTASLTGGETAITGLVSTPGGRAAITTANVGDQMVMTVVVDPNYKIDYISVTPIGFDLKWQTKTPNANEHIYIFEMPPEDVTIQIHLSSSVEKDYVATLHVLNYGDTTRLQNDTAELYYKDGENEYKAEGDDSKLTADEAQTVDVKVYINNMNYYVLSAYVLSETGAMVRLYGDTLENVSINTSLPSSDPEATARFIMPASNVDVYITITDIDVPEEWATVALVATDGHMDGTLKNDGARTAIISENEADDFLYEIDYARGRISGPLSTTDIDIGEVPSGGNEDHKAYIVEVDGSSKRIKVNEGNKMLAPEYEFSPPATLTSSGTLAPTLYNESIQPYYSYYYTMPTDDTVTRMHYVFTDVEAADLRVEIIDSENPSDNTVANSVSVNAQGKTPLELTSVTSAGAWHVVPAVAPGGTVSFVADPFHEDAIVIATLVDPFGGETVVELTKNADGTYSGSFEMPAIDTTLRVEFTYSSVTLTLIDRSTDAETTVAHMQVWVGADVEDIILPVGSDPVIAAPGTSSVDALSEAVAADTGDSSGVGEVATAAIITDAAPGDTTQTVSGIPNYTTTYTEVALGTQDVLTAVIAENGSGTSDLLLKRGEYVADKNFSTYFYTYGESEVTVLVEDYNADPTASRYPVVLKLIDANETETAAGSLKNSDPIGQTSGATWTTAVHGNVITVNFTVDTNRAATFSKTDVDAWPAVAYDAFMQEYGTANGGTISDPAAGIPAGTYTFSFTVDGTDISTSGGYELTIRYRSLSKISLAVLDTTRVVGNTASLAIQSISDTSKYDDVSPEYSSDGTVVNAIIATKIIELSEVKAITDAKSVKVSAKGNGSTTVVRAYIESESGMTDITSYVVNGTAFDVPSGETTIWVVYGNASGSIPDPVGPDPDDPLYTARIVVDTEGSDENWDTAGNRVIALINSTDTSALGGTLWKTASAGDEIRGTFAVVDGWYAEVTVSPKISFIRQTSANAELVLLQQPLDSDSVITVRFVKITPDDPEPSPSYELHFSIIGHDGQAGNTAMLTINYDAYPENTDNPKTLNGATAGAVDPYTEKFNTKVPVGTQLELQAGWAEGYSIKKITVEIRDANDEDTILAAYTVAGSEYNDTITAWMSMPAVDEGTKAYVCVYYANEYTATLHYKFLNGGTGTAEMYDAADKAGTVVTTEGGKIEGLAGSETIRTEPEAYADSRLVNVVYETPLTGAHLTTAYSADLDGDSDDDIYHDFTMPEEDTEVYVVYEPEDSRRSYIAAVTLEGETAEPGNDATIVNVSRASSVGTQYWTTAQSGDTIEITVSLAEGYQAKVTAVYPDGNNDLDGSTGELYVTRTLFPVDGTTTTFTMPLDSDAIVTIEFIKGYTATLVLKDSTTESNTAMMTDGTTTIKAENKSGSIEYTKTDAAGGIIGGANSITEIGIGTSLDGNVVLTDNSKLARLLYTTETGGTYNVGDLRLQLDADEAALPRPDGTTATYEKTVDWYLEALKRGDPVEDVVITAVVVDKDDNPLVAKVQLEGASDINGNTATIANAETGSWLTGDIWTTTAGNKTVLTTVTLATGYSALVTVINDDLYYAALDKFKTDNDAALANGSLTEADAISYARKEARMGFTLSETVGGVTTNTVSTGEPKTASVSGAIVSVEMPTDSDITVILEFNGEPGPRPYAPDNRAYSYGGVDYLERGWIYGTNRGDYATITVPTLLTDSTPAAGLLGVLDDVYRPATDGDAGVSNLFRISVWVESVNNFVDLSTSELIFTPVTKPVEYTDYPYNVVQKYQGIGSYEAVNLNAANDTGYSYNGAMFNIELAELAEGVTPSAAYTAFAEILAGNGSYSTKAPLGTLLQIRAISADGRVSEPTQLVIPPYYSLEGTIVSYAPMHDATFTLYELGADGNYKTEAHTVETLEQDDGYGKWLQNFTIRSSDLGGRVSNNVRNDLAALVGDTTTGAYSSSTDAPPTYKLTIEKAAVVTYEREGIVLEISDGTAVGGFEDDANLRGWILGRESSSSSSSSGTASYSIGESASANLGAVYSVGGDTDVIYGIGEDASAYTLESSSEQQSENTGGGIGENAASFALTNSAARAEDAAPQAGSVVVRDMIILITGDVDGDDLVIHTDQDILYYYINHRDAWTLAVEGEVGWERSVFNPDSEAYRCDIDGDGYINTNDLAAFYDYNYNKTYLDYGSPTGLVRKAISAYDSALMSFLNSISGETDVSDFLPPDAPSESLPPALTPGE